MMLRNQTVMLGMAVLLVSGPPAWSAEPLPQSATVWDGGKEGCKELPRQATTQLGLIRQMLAAGKPHAAIAYLDAARIAAPQAELLRGHGLRKTGREEEAGRVYRQLLKSCVAGYAYQGLGLIAFDAGKTAEAVAHLRTASTALPIDAAVRNDFGYALMVMGEHKAAAHEFLTAIELAPGNRRAEKNLLLLLTRMGEESKVQAFAEQFGISREELAEIRQIAQNQGVQGADKEAALGMTTDTAGGAAEAAQPATRDGEEPT